MIRVGGLDDVELVFSIQREASIAGFANVFPPERYPYPDEVVRRELRRQLEDPANTTHGAALDMLRSHGSASASLWCLVDNARARRFYEQRGWRLNGNDRGVPFPPYPLDVGYSIDL